MATILIVDDAPGEIALLKTVVERLGHTTLTAQNGKIGVQLAKQHKPGLVLLDIVLPGRDGFVTCRQIKKNPDTAHIPVLLVSSKSTDSYITKPFSPASLGEAVKKWVAA